MKPDILLLTLQNDMLANILTHASDIGKCSEHITVQIREIIGARIVALFELNPMDEYRLLAACPERRSDFFTTEEGRNLIASAVHFTRATSIEPGRGEMGEMLAALGMKESYVVPLRVGEESFGLLVLLDLMDDRGAGKILEVLHDISGVLSLVFKNSYLFRNMESLVADRTKALRESEETFRKLFEDSSNAILLINNTGVFVECNQAALDLLKMTREQFIHSPPARISPEFQPDGRRSAEAAPEMIALAYSKGLHRFDWTCVNAKGAEFIVEVSLMPVTIKGQTMLHTTWRDITERKRAEEALLESERQINSIFRSAPVGIGSVVNRVLSKVNNRLCEMTGYEEADLIGQSSRMLYPCDEDFEFVGREKYSQIADHGTGTVETRWQKHDGTIIDVLLSSTPVNLQDHSRGVTFTALDITERKQAEEALRESEERFKALHNASFGGIAIHDQGVILECNQGLSEISGFGYDELIGMDGLLLIAEQSREAVMANIHSGWEKPYEVFGMRKNGEEYPLRLEARNLPYKGAMVRVVEFRDITEPKKAEEALIRQQRFIKLNNRIANVFLTSSRNEVFADVLDVVLTALDSRFGFFGYIDEAGDLVSPTLTRDVWDQCQVADKSIVFPRANWRGLWGRSLIEKQTFIANENLLVPKGHVALKNALATPIVYNDNLIGQFVVANKAGGYDKDDQDLLESVAAQTAPILFALQEESRRKIAHEKLEVQLHQAQKMESVGRLAGGVAHDFNNMLGVILGYTELAMERVYSDDPLRTHLEKIQGAAQRSADLTRQLLAFARKQTVSPKVIDLNDTIESILKLLLRLIGEDIDLAWRPGKEVWPVKIDPTQVDQILTNLCVNARDAIVDTGKLTIETGIASFDEEYCSHHAGFVVGDYVLLAVSDTGCGMDDETQSHLFEPFFTTKEMGKGTGLGLATVYGVVKQNNGFINVYSEPGQGTTFKIYLPRHLDKTAPLLKQEPDKPGERGRENVLLVEDEPAIMDMTAEMLERLGYTVLAAGTPGEAIRLAQEHPGRIDLLLTDVVMPEMNGRDLAKNLLSIYPDIRRLFMSGYTANVIAHHGVLDEGVHFIQKPFSMKDLGEKLREAMKG